MTAALFNSGITLALETIRVHKMRSFLTVLLFMCQKGSNALWNFLPISVSMLQILVSLNGLY